MSFLLRPPVNPEGARPGDELDGLLSAYFRAEMPNPWPAVAVPETSEGSKAPVVLDLPAEPAPQEPSWSLFRSRLALAASVALLIAGSFFLGGRFTDDPSLNGSAGKAEKRNYGTLPPDVKMSVGLEQHPDGPTDLKILIEPLAPGK
jgi:hypothetical protein